MDSIIGNNFCNSILTSNIYIYIYIYIYGFTTCTMLTRILDMCGNEGTMFNDENYMLQIKKKYI